jgi:hypothetical protein
MSDNPDNTDATNHSTMPDPFTVALALCQVAANAKTIEPALKRLRKLGRDIAKAEQKLAAVTAQVEQKQTALAERQAALAAREAAITDREDKLASELAEARDSLRVYYDNIAEADRHVRYRVMSYADLLGGFNPTLQDLPTWPQIRRLVAGLPEDLPAAPEVIRQENAREDWTGNVFVPGSTLTRSINKAANERI